jgi:hypothetical protein
MYQQQQQQSQLLASSSSKISYLSSITLVFLILSVCLHSGRKIQITRARLFVILTLTLIGKMSNLRIQETQQ